MCILCTFQYSFILILSTDIYLVYLCLSIQPPTYPPTHLPTYLPTYPPTHPQFCPCQYSRSGDSNPQPSKRERQPRVTVTLHYITLHVCAWRRTSFLAHYRTCSDDFPFCSVLFWETRIQFPRRTCSLLPSATHRHSEFQSKSDELINSSSGTKANTDELHEHENKTGWGSVELYLQSSIRLHRVVLRHRDNCALRLSSYGSTNFIRLTKSRAQCQCNEPSCSVGEFLD
jgi:hypothetical protein